MGVSIFSQVTSHRTGQNSFELHQGFELDIALWKGGYSQRGTLTKVLSKMSRLLVDYRQNRRKLSSSVVLH